MPPRFPGSKENRTGLWTFELIISLKSWGIFEEIGEKEVINKEEEQ